MAKKSKEYKGVRDEIREQQMKAKDMTFKEKLAYFWYYYKVHTIAGIFSVICIISLIHGIVTNKDYAFYSIMLNSYGLSGDELSNSFADYAKLDTEEYNCYIDTASTLNYSSMSQYDMATSQKMIALMQTKDLDSVVFDYEVFENFSFNEMFLDLRTVFTEAELLPYQDNLYYMDYALIRANDERDEFDDSATYNAPPKTEEEIAAELESHRHPENMKEPVPVGIFVKNAPLIKDTDCYSSLEPVFGVIATTQRIDQVKAFLSYLWDDSIDFSNVIQEPY